MEAPSRKTILLVEDEEIIAAAQTLQLAREGYSVVRARGGEEAVVIARRDPLDLVLMDINLGPGMDGTEAAREILRSLDLPIVFVSAHTEREIVEKTEKITSYGYVVKNSGAVVLMASIRMAFKLFEANRRIARELEERTRAEAAARASEERILSIFRAAPTGIGVVVDRVIKEANQRIYDMTGYSPKDLIGKSARVLYPSQEDFEFVGREKYRQIALQGTGVVETRWMRKDGTVIDILLASTPIDLADLSKGITFTALDITEGKRAAEELREKTEEVNRYFSASLDLFCIADTDGYFVHLNPEWERTLGYPLAELEGRRFLDFVHPDDLAGTMSAIAELDAQREILNFTNRYRHRDGSYRWIEWRSIPKGKRIYAAARDITERIRSEETIRELLAEKEALLKEARLRGRANPGP